MGTKVLVLDIDGTLTNSEKQITSETKRGIRDIMERGHKVILASGRPTPGMRRYEEELELKKYGGYLLSFNGGKVIECKSQQIIYQQFLPLKIIPGLYQFAKEKGCGLATYLEDRVISAFDPDPYLKWEAHINRMEIDVVTDFIEFVNFDIHKCLMTAEPEKAQIYEKKIQKTYGEYASIYRSEDFFIEIMPKGINKGGSLDKTLKAAGLNREDAICCGDGFNDISMIEYAGVGVAMGNAKEVVKNAADYITGSNDEDGIVQVIDRFVL